MTHDTTNFKSINKSIMGEINDFADISNQIYNSAKARTWKFNLMIVGEAREGKSTLVQALFRGKISPSQCTNIDGLTEYESLIEENKVMLRLRCIETSGFLPDYYKEKLSPFVEHIEKQFEKYLIDERSKAEHLIDDTRIHCCIYLIPTNRDRLRPIDIDCMLALHDKVNLIPIIAKADSLPSAEALEQLKQNILDDFEKHKIRYYDFLAQTGESDEETIECIKKAASKFPFALVATDRCEESNGHKKWLLRKPTGIADIENEQHSDFVPFSKLLIKYCMLDLMDNTHCQHYAKYKTDIISDQEMNS